MDEHTGFEATRETRDDYGLDRNEPVGNFVTFGNNERCPTIKTDCADLAVWIANEICGSPMLPNGGAVNVTGVKGPRTLAVLREPSSLAQDQVKEVGVAAEVAV